MAERLRVALVTPEVSPFAGAGRVADYAAGLARRLAARGADVSLIVPKYGTPEGQLLSSVLVQPPLGVPLDGGLVKAGVFAAEEAGVSIYLIDHPRYFLRDKIYGSAGASYLDNDERFVFFSRAAAELLQTFDPPVDVVHCQDWPTALVPVFLKTHYRTSPALGRAATVLTIHTPGEQGEFPPESLAWTGLNWDFFDRRPLDLNGKFNFLKAGMAYSDIVDDAAPTAVPGGEDEKSWQETADACVGLYAKALDLKRGGSCGRRPVERH